MASISSKLRDSYSHLLQQLEMHTYMWCARHNYHNALGVKLNRAMVMALLILLVYQLIIRSCASRYHFIYSKMDEPEDLNNVTCLLVRDLIGESAQRTFLNNCKCNFLIV